MRYAEWIASAFPDIGQVLKHVSKQIAGSDLVTGSEIGTRDSEKGADS